MSGWRSGRRSGVAVRGGLLRHAIAVCLLGCVCVATATADERAGAGTRFDFDALPLSRDWTVAGPIRAARGKLPEAAPEGLKEGTGPRGEAVLLEADGPAMFYTKPKVVAADWGPNEEIAFWLHSPGEKLAIEVRAIEADAKARFWRKVEVDHKGWKEVRLPLAWFRDSDGRVPHWSQIAHLGFYLRGKGKIALDEIRLIDADSKVGATRTVDVLLPMAFPDTAKEKVRVKSSARVSVVTNAEALDIDALAAHLEKVADAVDADWAFLPKDRPPGVLFVFATENEYRAFVPRFAQKLGGEAARPASGGFTTQGIATSSWDAEKGSLRPVYCHEFVHSYLSPRLSLANRGEWFHEGIATWYQLTFHPQENFGELVRTELGRGEGPPSFDTLANGERIRQTAYWQAGTAVGALLSAPEYRARLPKLVEGFASSASTKITPHWELALDTDEEAFRAKWRRFVTERYVDVGKK